MEAGKARGDDAHSLAHAHKRRDGMPEGAGMRGFGKSNYCMRGQMRSDAKHANTRSHKPFVSRRCKNRMSESLSPKQIVQIPPVPHLPYGRNDIAFAIA